MNQILNPWSKPASIQPNHFVYKSLSDWSYNVAVGCAHACRFCYVPDVSTIKLGAQLKTYGVDDPDAEWGSYVLVRPWDLVVFRNSLRRAENTPLDVLSRDGNRAVMFCTTTDPYQVFTHPVAAKRKEMQDKLEQVVRAALTLILHESTLNVRILTRGPLASRDFDLFRKFGKRLLFGMSLPTLDNRMAKVYEPHAPAPSARLDTLKRAKDAGLNVYVAMAPTYPELTPDDLFKTLVEIKQLDPVTVFHEPINIRAENVQRIREHAAKVCVELKTEVWRDRSSWAEYSMAQMKCVEIAAQDIGLDHRLHLWPDKDLLKYYPEKQDWFLTYWNRVSEWPV